MGAIREDQKENASKFMTDFWNNLVKPYYNPEDTDSYFDAAYDKVIEISKKYCENDERLTHILMGFWDGLEKEAKRGNNI